MGRYTPSDEKSASGNWFKMTALDDGPVKVSMFGDDGTGFAELTGYECWKPDGKPARATSLAELLSLKPAAGWRVEKGKEAQPKFFLARCGYNHKAKKFMTFMFAQKTIRQQLETMVENGEDFGDLRGYDIILSRVCEGSGDTKKVTYSVQGVQRKKPLPPEVLAEWKRIESECLGLPAIFNDGDPLALFGDDNVPPF
jgi:hypothetical protein